MFISHVGIHLAWLFVEYVFVITLILSCVDFVLFVLLSHSFLEQKNLGLRERRRK